MCSRMRIGGSDGLNHAVAFADGVIAVGDDCGVRRVPCSLVRGTINGTLDAKDPLGVLKKKKQAEEEAAKTKKELKDVDKDLIGE